MNPDQNMASGDPEDEDQMVLESVSERWPVDADKAFKALRSRVVPEHITNIFASMLILVLSVVLMFVVLEAPAGYPGLVLLGFCGMLAIAAMIMSVQYHRRRINLKRVGQRFQAGAFATTCPGCGHDPFEAERDCCRRFPARWSTLDLHAFWHELAAGRDDGSEARKQAWNRCRGKAGTSAEHPRLGASSLMRKMFRHESAARFILLLSAVVFVGWMILQGIFNQVTSSLILLGFLMYGLFKSVLGLRRKPPIGTRTRPRCRRCGYQLHPPFPECCTECGEDLGKWDSITFDPDDTFLGGGTARTLKQRLRRKSRGTTT